MINTRWKKNKIAFIFLFVTGIASAQKNNAPDTIPQPVITEVGKPIGKIVEKIMNKDGGRLVLKDGTLELIIPDSALSKNDHYQYSNHDQYFQKW